MNAADQRRSINSVTLEGNWSCRLNKGTTLVCQIEFFILCCNLVIVKFAVK